MSFYISNHNFSYDVPFFTRNPKRTQAILTTEPDHGIHELFGRGCPISLALGFSFHSTILLTPGEGVLPYISYIGMCRPKGYGF